MESREQMQNRFGDDDTESFFRGMRATRSYVRVWGAFLAAPDGSYAEEQIADAVEQMAQGMEESPKKAVVVAQILVTLIHHMKDGGTIDEFFEGVDG